MFTINLYSRSSGAFVEVWATLAGDYQEVLALAQAHEWEFRRQGLFFTVVHV